MKKYVAPVLKAVSVLEVVLAIVIILAVIIHGVALIADSYGEMIDGSLTFLEDFISDVLLLVIGLELAIVLIRHTPESVLQVMIFAVARKTLIYTEDAYQIALGVIALAALYATRKYLCQPADQQNSDHQPYC